MKAVKKQGRYQVKKRQGLVPSYYDRDSRSFAAGAFKNWPPQAYRETDGDYGRRLWKLACAETPSRNGRVSTHGWPQ